MWRFDTCTYWEMITIIMWGFISCFVSVCLTILYWMSLICVRNIIYVWKWSILFFCHASSIKGVRIRSGVELGFSFTVDILTSSESQITCGLLPMLTVSTGNSRRFLCSSSSLHFWWCLYFWDWERAFLHGLAPHLLYPTPCCKSLTAPVSSRQALCLLPQNSCFCFLRQTNSVF